MKLKIRNDLILEGCNDHKEGGCYIRFKKGKVYKSKPRDDCVVDYDENYEIIGIEFYEGLDYDSGR